ncbi:putative Cysteine protease ATG4B [Blattamonas nauphoetae]|uniref:Cysteine protease n=1 Tax=Blattamonas nauphoetae TaxID=2049346 RepID=A0ABQ9X257_9EUKA|nr:putative Cysteine protease ATG4B [Blattamonas nauphoetae]
MTARSPLHTMDKSFNSSFTTHFPSDDSRHRSHPQENSNEWVMADLEDEEGDWENISIQTTPYLSSRSTLVSAPAFITSDLLSPFHPPSEPGVPTPSPTAHLMRNTRPIKIAEIARSPQTNAKQLPSEPTLQSPVVPSHVKKSNFSVRTHAVPDSPLSRPLGLTIDSAEFIDSPLNESVLHQYPSTHSSRSTSCIVLIPIRLGLFTVDPILFSSLLECLHHPTSLGIIGGKPRNSLWFVGHQGNELFYLDPHTTQPATKDLSTLNINTYHVQSIERIAIDKIDPSMMLCFLIRNSAEYAQFCQLVHIMPSPIFSVQESR